MRLMEGEHIGPFNLGNPGEFTMLELAEVSIYYPIHLAYELNSNIDIISYEELIKLIRNVLGNDDDSSMVSPYRWFKKRLTRMQR